VPEDDAMKDCTGKPGDGKEVPTWGPDTIEARMRTRIRETIEMVVEEELEAALGAAPSVRVGETRQGYRHGTRERTLTTSVGPTSLAMPRARIHQPDGTTTEWRSETVRRYQRRTTRVDEAILGVYLAGGNTRRIKGALAPLLRGGPLSKDAVSRLVGRLREAFDTWRSRDLADEDIRYVFMDGWYPKVRIGGRRERVPVLVTLGVRANGERVVLDMRLVGEESAASWTEVVANLASRHLARPVLAVIDGNPGLTNALRSHWPGLAIQRCTAHIAGRDPRLLRGEMSPPGQVPMRPVVWGQTWRGNWPRRSRPDTVASVPSPEAQTKPRAATKVNAFGAVNASWTSIAGRVQDQGGRVACVPTKTPTTVETWGSEAVVPSAFEAAAREEGDVGERTRAHEVGGGSAVVSADIRRDPLKIRVTLCGQSEEAIVARKVWTAKPTGAKGLYLSQASYRGRTA
jgi:Transposase, Mutator family